MWGSGSPRSSSGSRNRARSDAMLTSQCKARSIPPAWREAVDARHPDLAAPFDVPEGEVVGAVPLDVEVVGAGASREVAADAEPLVGAGEAHGVERRAGGRPRSRRASTRGTCPGCRRCAARVDRRAGAACVRRRVRRRSGSRDRGRRLRPTSRSRQAVDGGGVVVEDLPDDVVGHPGEEIRRVVARPLRGRPWPGVLARRVRIVGLEEEVVGVALDGVERGATLEPEAAVDLATEILARQQVVLRVLVADARRCATASRTSRARRGSTRRPTRPTRT